ncbi:antibiotic biosynthesis monooxygenase family protein [Bacillus sp. CRN 9]|uniref:antibiotic biosynthesis monooxygenase family protein n=1 Tax=Cytobacillus horneckiae TaxID=549687 RepID=UPI00156293AE|nr:antibiotic biosynthesis monooxygenase [Bacillus sp. CRN 9]
MNFYITSGTKSFLSMIKKKHNKEEMTFMQNSQHSLLVHETAKKSKFQQPRSYKIIDQYGQLSDGSFASLNYIPVTDEGKPIFIYTYKNLSEKLDKAAGLQAVRVLEPFKSNTFVVLTVWKNETYYKDWEATDSFKNLKPTNNNQQILADPAYSAHYYIQNDEE